MTVAADVEDMSYRSLSALAVVSLLLGIVSLLSFAPSPVFIYTLPPAAFLTGLLAIRQIRSAPEVWTGRRLAHLGIGLALVSAIGAGTAKYLDSARVHRHGLLFAERFADKLRQGDVEGAFWLTVPRESRRNLVGKQLNEITGDVAERYMAFRTEVNQYATALAAGDARLEFVEMESAIIDGTSEYAAAVYKFVSKDNTSHVLVLASSGQSPETHRQSWYIRQHQFGYESKSFRPPSESGHGHSH